MLGEVRREGARPGEALHAAPGFRAIGAVARILPGVVIPVSIVEDRRGGEAYCVRIISGGPEALRSHCTVGGLAVRR